MAARWYLTNVPSGWTARALELALPVSSLHVNRQRQAHTGVVSVVCDCPLENTVLLRQLAAAHGWYMSPARGAAAPPGPGPAQAKPKKSRQHEPAGHAETSREQLLKKNERQVFDLQARSSVHGVARRALALQLVPECDHGLFCEHVLRGSLPEERRQDAGLLWASPYTDVAQQVRLRVHGGLGLNVALRGSWGHLDKAERLRQPPASRNFFLRHRRSNSRLLKRRTRAGRFLQSGSGPLQHLRGRLHVEDLDGGLSSELGKDGLFINTVSRALLASACWGRIGRRSGALSLVLRAWLDQIRCSRCDARYRDAQNSPNSQGCLHA